jgi:uncharacterized protein
MKAGSNDSGSKPMVFLNRFISRASPETALRRAVQLTSEGRFEEAFPLLSLAAKAGMADAEYLVARSYLEGSGVPVAKAEGVRWLRRAASHGYIEAQLLLGVLCLRGLAGIANSNGNASAPRADRLFAVDEPTDPDFAAAAEWALQAAKADSARGQALLGYILSYGPESLRDPDAAHGWYERSAAQGCPEGNLGFALSMASRATVEDAWRKVVWQLCLAARAGLPTALYLLGILTEKGIGLASDPTTAIHLYRHAAEKGHYSAQVRWGVALLEGRHVEQDRDTGESWLRSAALAGDSLAAVLIGNLYVRSNPSPPNYVEAARWYRRAAEAGNKEAARALASLYLTGAGVERNNDDAVRWLRFSAEAGDQTSQVDLANLVLAGAGDAGDPQKVARWFKEAAASNDLFAAFNFGICLSKGLGVKQDEQRAAIWIRRAANGVRDAQYIYGRMLADGRGVAPDLVEARAWLVRASDSGMPDAQVALAEMMVNGRGGPRDVLAARRLFEKAAAQNHSGAMFALGALNSGGHGLPVDRITAQRYFSAAAKLGHGYAQLMLGRYLARGVAGSPNRIEARSWLERALADAQNDLAELSSQPSVGDNRCLPAG